MSMSSSTFSPREAQVADLVGQGMDNRAIASALRLAEGSVKNLVHRALEKSGSLNRVELAVKVATKPATVSRANHVHHGRVGYNLATCDNCGHNLREQLPEMGAQIWACMECGSLRQWGFSRPWDAGMKPTLECELCDAVTRHNFVGLAGFKN